MGLSRGTIKRGIILSVSISIIALILVLLLTQNDLTFKSFKEINANYLIMAGVITIIFWLLRALKLQVFISSLGGQISFHSTFAIYLASVFVGHITPSTVGGLPFQIYFLHKEGLPLGKTTALTVMDSMLTFIFFMLAAPVLLLIWGDYLNLDSGITKLFYLAIVLFVLFIVFTLALIFKADMSKNIVNWLISLKLVKRFFKEDTLLKFSEYMEKELNYFNEGISLLWRDKRDMFLVIIYTILYWFFYLSLAPVLLKGLGIKIAIPAVILAQLVFNFIQPIIPTPGSSGGAELGFAYLFKFMVPGYLLGIFVAVWRFFMFYASLIIGGIYFIYLVQGTDYLNN